MKPTAADPTRAAYPFGLDDVADAARVLDEVIVRTPLLENPDVNARLGGRLLIKAESMQRTGAFKIRGAYNCIRQLSAAEKARGAITYSSGNHAQGVALAARLFGTSALIVMPGDTPPAKIDATRRLGAQIVTYDRDRKSSDEVVERIRAQTGRVEVPPSGDPRVLAGAGTVALEICEQSREARASPDIVLVPCGGGGLAAATAIVMQARSPATRVYAVEPTLFDDTRRSFAAGVRVKNPPGRRTICDSIMTPTPGSMTFPINRDLLAGALVADDDEVRAAMGFAYAHYRAVIEPGGAVGIAAVLNGSIDLDGTTVVVVATGGNVDAEHYGQILASAPARAGMQR